MYHIFLGAPSAKKVNELPENYAWSISQNIEPLNKRPSLSFFIPPATLDAANSRISMLYRHAIFHDGEEEEREEVDPNEEYSIPSISMSRITSISRRPSNLSRLSFMETQEGTSYGYSDTSSIVRFPTFQFDMHSLASLASLTKPSAGKRLKLVLAILEVEGPDNITLKRGPDAGKQISILKLILGDEEGKISKLTAWREIAEKWGNDMGVKRGDVVFIENVTSGCEPQMSPTLSASPYYKSTLQICYRALPYAHEDMRLRPDLRLAANDPCVRKVATLVQWFEKMAGLVQF